VLLNVVSSVRKKAAIQERNTFQVNKRDHKRLSERKRRLGKRLERKQYEDQAEAMFKQTAISYEMGGRVEAMGYGGIGAIHNLVCKLGLDEALNEAIKLLKIHVPYHESDHILNMAYNVMSGGRCLEDIERLRNDEGYIEQSRKAGQGQPSNLFSLTQPFPRTSLSVFDPLWGEIPSLNWGFRPHPGQRSPPLQAKGH